MLTLRIKTKSAEITLEIPTTEEGEISVSSTPSAPSTLPEQQRPTGEAASANSEENAQVVEQKAQPLEWPKADVLEEKLKQVEPAPLSDMTKFDAWKCGLDPAVAERFASYASGEKENEGEVGEGVEGGVGEEEGEVEREKEEKPERFDDIHHFEFPCEGSQMYVPNPALVRDFVLAFGEEHVRIQFIKARSWLIANPQKRKTQRGMGRFLNAWLCRESGMQRTPIKSQPLGKSLLDGNKTSQGW